MDTHYVAPRIATTDRPGIRREGRPLTHRFAAAGVAVSAAILAIAVAACSPAASNAPAGSLALPSVPGVDMSAGASMATDAGLAALDQIDAAIAANQTSGALTATEASDLQELATGVRTALQSGDTTAASTAVANLSTKVTEFASKLNTPTGEQLKAALAALEAALPS